MTAATCPFDRKHLAQIGSQPCAIFRVANASKTLRDLRTLATGTRGAAMGIYEAATYPDGYDFPISTLFWGAVIVVALFVCCLLVSKAIGWLRARRQSGDVPDEPTDPWGKAISRPASDFSGFSGLYGDEAGGLGGMSQREQEEFFSVYAPRKVRRIMRARKKARERRQRH
jgi:hypothetical protein